MRDNDIIVFLLDHTLMVHDPLHQQSLLTSSLIRLDDQRQVVLLFLDGAVEPVLDLDEVLLKPECLLFFVELDQDV